MDKVIISINLKKNYFIDSFESGLEKIKEENCLKLEKKQRRNTDEILNKKPMNLFGKEVILEKINLEERVRRMRQKTDLKTNEMSTKV